MPTGRPRVPCGMTWTPPLAWFRITAIAIVVLTVAAGCGGSASGDRGIGGSTTTTPTTLGPTAAAVLSAYRAEWAAFEHAAATSNIFDPMLPATMVDPQLQEVRRNLAGDKVNGIVGRGTFTLHPRITSLTSTMATVVDCAYSTSELVYADSGKPVPPSTPPEYDGVKATLVLVGSTWKVSQQVVTDGSCSSGP